MSELKYAYTLVEEETSSYQGIRQWIPRVPPNTTDKLEQTGMVLMAGTQYNGNMPGESRRPQLLIQWVTKRVPVL